MEYLMLFLTFAKIGAITFGGGLAMLPILKREVVENKGWATGLFSILDSNYWNPYNVISYNLANRLYRIRGDELICFRKRKK